MLNIQLEKGMESSSVVFDEDSITLRAPKINLEIIKEGETRRNQ